MGGEQAPVPQPGHAGPGRASPAQHVEVLSWNRLDFIEERLSRGDVAARDHGTGDVQHRRDLPGAGLSRGVREACTRTGTVLIFDEVITGFRVGPGGAQEKLGVTPDLTIFGKAVANGFPVAGLAGTAALMDLFATGKVMHGGTYNSQSVAMAATVATLKALKAPGTYETLERQGTRLMRGVEAAFADGRRHGDGDRASREIFHVGFGLSEPPRNYRDILATDRAGYVRLTTALLERGVRVLERGAWFISTQHDDAVIDETLSSLRDALASL